MITPVFSDLTAEKPIDRQNLKADKIFFPNLDGLRFIAFFSVFLYHSCYTEFPELINHPVYQFFKKGIFSYGSLGVNFFFVLSGFLITYLLAHEEKLNNKVDMKSFYVRRTLRIWPLYAACLIFGFFIFPLLKSALGQAPSETANLFLFLAFLGNINNIINGLPDASVLGVLWSVGIEEQFYLFWPILFMLFRSKTKPWMFAGIIVGSIVFRFFNFDHYFTIYFHTFSVISDMALGGLVGWACFTKPAFLTGLKRIPKYAIVGLYILGFIVIAFSRSSNHQVWVTFERFVLSLFFVFIILEQNFSDNSFYKIRRNRFVTYWGKYTYGLYSLHFIGFLITTNTFKLLKMNNSLFHVMVVETFVSLILTMILSWISFNYFEKYFLRLKNRFSYQKAYL